MINTRFIWYLEKYGILEKSQCGFRKHRSTTDHLVSLERYVRDAFAQKQQAVGLFFDLEKAYETTWQYGIIRDLHRIGLRGRLPVFVSEYLRDRRIRVRIGNTLSDEFYPEEGVPTCGVLALTCFGLNINELPSLIPMDIFRTLFVDDLAICVRGRSLDTIERHLQQAVNARNGQKGMGSGLQPINVKLYISLHPDTKSRDPPQSGSVTHSCQLRNQQNSLGCGGIRTSPSKNTSVH